jgi:hypothetical protein
MLPIQMVLDIGGNQEMREQYSQSNSLNDFRSNHRELIEVCLVAEKSMATIIH